MARELTADPVRYTHPVFRRLFAIRAAPVPDPIRGVRPPELDADRLRSEFEAAIAEVERSAIRAGLRADAIDSIRLALAATLDEAMRDPGAVTQPLRESWLGRPLVRIFFEHDQGGDRFFDSLEHWMALEPSSAEQTRERHDVLAIYYLCLLFGFRGKYGVQGGQDQLTHVIEDVRRALAPPVREVTLLERRGGPDRLHRPRTAPLLLLLALLGTALALTAFLFTHIDLRSKFQRTHTDAAAAAAELEDR